MSSEVLSLWRGRTADDAVASGRDAELSMLLREHDEAKSSERARFVFIKGPSGVGKSHLFGLLRAAAARKNVPVFEGGSGRDARRTFGLFAPMVSELLAHLEQDGVPASRLAELARVLSPLTKATASNEVMENRRVDLYDAVCELFSLAGRSSPVFLFPDLDVADRASLELFRYVAAVATTPGARAGGLFAASLRDDGSLPAPLSEVLAKVPARSLPMAGLDVDGIRAYLSRGDVAQRLLEVTGGNPEAIERLLDRPAAPALDFFSRRAQQLEPAQRAVLDALSISKNALPLSVLRESLHDADVASQLDVLVAGRYLAAKVVDGAPVYRFARETERQAWLQTMDSKRRGGVQREVARALVATGELVTGASLLLELGRDAESVELGLKAGDELSARGAHEDAAELYSLAMVDLTGAARAKVLDRLAVVLAAQGDFHAAARALLESNRVAPHAGKPLMVARHLVRLGRLQLAWLALKAPLKVAATRFEAESVAAEIELVRGSPAKAIELARKALQSDVAVEAGISLRNIMGRALLAQGASAEAGELFAQNAEAADAAGLKDVASLARLNRGVALYKQGDREGAIACYQAAQSHSLGRHWALANLGSLYSESGDFEPALDCLTRALQVVTRHGGPKETAHVASNLSRLHHFLGDFERAAELSEHALALSSSLGDAYLEGSALLNLGAIALDRKDFTHSARTLEAARLKLDAVGNDGYSALAAALKARAHLAMGERAQAEAELSRRTVDKGAAAMQAAAIEVELTRGELALQLGDLHGAGRAGARAKDALLQSPDLEGPFRVYLLMGKLRAAAGDASGAQGELLRAWRLLDELAGRVPPVRRAAFLSVPRRAELLAAVEPELKLPRSAALPTPVPEKKLGLVGRAPALQRIIKQLEPVGRSNASVLIRGESGTGKELLAEALHQLSPRRAMPLIKVNCAAMVEELLLSELFGHEKGAFTGAIRERKGRFELADGGTLFLDEIGDISPKCQVALLRVLQEHELERVGGTKTIRVDVRLICATNRDLEQLIAQGRFRADLYYRLKGVMLELPSLRERTEDLPMLAQHFLERVAKDRHEGVKRLSAEAMALLLRHDWPGNVRELENVLSAGAIFAEGDVISPEAFSHVAELRSLLESSGELAAAPVVPAARPMAPMTAAQVASAPSVSTSSPGAVTLVPEGPIDYFELARKRDISLKDLRHEVEMQCIKRALAEANGNISEAARLLKMKRSRLSQIVNAEGELKEVAHGDDE